MNEDLISVVVLSWNRKDLTVQCLESLRRQAYKNLEVIVVDNASTDGSVEVIRKNYPEVKLIVNKENLGFGGGNNIGIKNSRGKYVAMMNNDTDLEPECIAELKKAIDKSERYGAAASKIILESDKSMIDAAGIVVYPDGLSIGRGRTSPQDEFNREEEVFFASDCACLYRRKMLEDVRVNGEIYDEDFFAYADETDLGWRARLRQWKCIYTPLAVVHHRHSASTADYDPFKVFLVERNRIFVAIKNFPLPFLLRAVGFTFNRYSYKIWAGLSGRGATGIFVRSYSKRQLIAVLARVYLSTARYLVKMLRKRSVIQKGRKISHREIAGIFKKFGISTREIAFKE